jgi:hypothetical protein
MIVLSILQYSVIRNLSQVSIKAKFHSTKHFTIYIYIYSCLKGPSINQALFTYLLSVTVKQTFKFHQLSLDLKSIIFIDFQLSLFFVQIKTK